MSIRNTQIFIISLLAANIAFAQANTEKSQDTFLSPDKQTAVEDSQFEKTLDLNDIKGRYTVSRNLQIAGDEYEATDVLEIIPLDEKVAYVQAKIHFPYAHECNFSGLAEWGLNKLTYYDARFGLNCIMEIIPDKNGITLLDKEQECRRFTCGARGVYDRASFPYSGKKSIANMEEVKILPEYQLALDEYKLYLKKGKPLGSKNNNRSN